MHPQTTDTLTTVGKALRARKRRQKRVEMVEAHSGGGDGDGEGRTQRISVGFGRRPAPRKSIPCVNI